MMIMTVIEDKENDKSNLGYIIYLYPFTFKVSAECGKLLPF